MRVSAKADYAMRAAVELARLAGEGPIKGDVIAHAQDIPLRFVGAYQRFDPAPAAGPLAAAVQAAGPAPAPDFEWGDS